MALRFPLQAREARDSRAQINKTVLRPLVFVLYFYVYLAYDRNVQYPGTR
jgi:hypothetical protein